MRQVVPPSHQSRAYRLDERSSSIITALRFPLTILVLLSHCVLVREYRPISLSFDGDSLFLAVDSLTRSFGSVVVSWFSLISGFFFFGTKGFGLGGYVRALSSRARSLLIPYLLWNLIYIGILWLKNDLSARVGFAPGVQPVEVALLRDSSLWQLIMMPLNHPLWYVRELIYLTLASPLIYLAVRYLRLGAVVFFGLAYVGLLPEGLAWLVPFSGEIAFYFVLGAYLRRAEIDPVALAARLRWVGLVGTLAYPILLWGHCDQPYFHWAFTLAKAGLLITVFNVASWLYARRSRLLACCTELSGAAFFVYAVHAIVMITLIRGLLYTTPLGSHGYGQIVILLLTGASVSLLSVLAYRISVRYMPRLAAVLCGGRI